MQKLTRREKEIFDLLLNGSMPKEIAYTLNITYNTVISHQRRLYRKLNVNSVDELHEKYQNLKQEYKPPLIYLEDGTYFIIYTFNEVNLLANRWIIKENIFYGENYHSLDRIRLKDIYNGSINNLLPILKFNLFKVKVTGSINKECKKMFLSIDYILPDNGIWVGVGYSELGKDINIGPGDFSVIFKIGYTGIDINTLPEGGQYIFDLQYCLHHVDLRYSEYIIDTGERIPLDMKNNSIWATINNLKIEPVP